MPHRLSTLAGCLLLGTAGILPAQQVPGWELVWSDEFDQADGSPPDPAKWGHDLGGSGWGNGEIQYYTDRTENSRIEGGQLVIEAREESFGGRNHTSARLLTKGKWNWTYGRFEARIRVPAGTGLWPAFWMLGSDIDAVGWPACGEIDIMEQVGRLPRELFGTLHGPGYSGGGAFGGSTTLATDVADAFHVFAVEWEEEEIRWYLDGSLYFTATPDDLGGSDWVFDHGFFMILNLAIGGTFGGPLDPALSFPRQLLVDYVRVYRREQGPGSNVLENPGFEDGALGAWTGYQAGGANDAGGYIETPANQYYNGGNPGGDPVEVRSGGHVAKVFGDFTGGENTNGFHQRVATDPGEVWNAGTWVLTHPQDLMTGANTAWIEVSFLDASGGVVGLHRSDVVDSMSLPPGEWVRLVVDHQLDPVSRTEIAAGASLEAPPGSTEVEVRAVFHQPGYDGGALYLDDFRLAIEVEPEPPALAIRAGEHVSWSPTNPQSVHQPQWSDDGLAWNPLGPAVHGNAESSAFSAERGRQYRVLETLPPGPGNGVTNPGFELTEPAAHPSPGATGWTIAAPEDLDPSNGFASIGVAGSFESHLPRSGNRMLVIDSTTPAAPASVQPPNSDTRSSFIPVEPSTAHELIFHAAHVVREGGANPQVNIRFYDAGFGYLGDTGHESFASAGTSWSEVRKPFTTPPATAWVTVGWIQALGAGNGWRWVTLIDDVEVPVSSAPGAEVLLPAAGVPGIEFSWATVPGFVDQLEFAGDLASFAPVGGPVTGDGTPASRSMPMAGPAGFGRVTRTRDEP